jgi:hypothetical protein
MVEKETLATEQIKYSGLAEFGNLYQFSYNYLRDEGFDVQEDKYTEKVSGDSKEIEAKWTANKKITDYFRIAIDVKIKVSSISDVEVEINGSKKVMNKVSGLTIDLKGTLETDYNNAWTGSKFQKFFRETYNKYIIPSKISKMEGETVKLIQDMKDELKALLELTGKR